MTRKVNFDAQRAAADVLNDPDVKIVPIMEKPGSYELLITGGLNEGAQPYGNKNTKGQRAVLNAIEDLSDAAYKANKVDKPITGTGGLVSKSGEKGLHDVRLGDQESIHVNEAHAKAFSEAGVRIPGFRPETSKSRALGDKQRTSLADRIQQRRENNKPVQR